MKKLTILFSLCMLMLSYVLISCEAEYIDLNAPTISISQIESENPDELSILFTPQKGTANYRYAISTSSDYSTFTAGTMDGIETVEGEEAKVAVFDELTAGTYYYVYAQAYGKENQSGGIATYKVLFADKNAVTVVQQYNLSTSAAFEFYYPSHYIQCRYYLGTKDDKDAFLDGTLEGVKALGDLTAKTYVTYFYLEPEKEYVFYAQATDILGLTTPLFEIPFTTPATDKAPYAEFEVVYQDAYREHYRLTPNAECGKIICLFNEVGEGAAGMVYGDGWNGDWMSLIQSWNKGSSQNPELKTYSAIGGPVEIIYDDLTFTYGSSKTMQAVLFDKSGQTPIGVQNWDFKKVDMPSDVQKANVTVTISDITTTGATYTYVADENTMGYFYDTIDADWWDENKDKFLAEDPYYLHNLLKADHIFAYPSDDENRTRTYTEQTGEPGKRYYAVACPANMKGPGMGWEDLVIAEYTTLSE